MCWKWRWVRDCNLHSGSAGPLHFKATALTNGTFCLVTPETTPWARLSTFRMEFAKSSGLTLTSRSKRKISCWCRETLTKLFSGRFPFLGFFFINPSPTQEASALKASGSSIRAGGMGPRLLPVPTDHVWWCDTTALFRAPTLLYHIPFLPFGHGMIPGVV